MANTIRGTGFGQFAREYSDGVLSRQDLDVIRSVVHYYICLTIDEGSSKVDKMTLPLVCALGGDDYSWALMINSRLDLNDGVRQWWEFRGRDGTNFNLFRRINFIPIEWDQMRGLWFGIDWVSNLLMGTFSNFRLSDGIDIVQIILDGWLFVSTRKENSAGREEQRRSMVIQKVCAEDHV